MHRQSQMSSEFSQTGERRIASAASEVPYTNVLKNSQRIEL